MLQVIIATLKHVTENQQIIKSKEIEEEGGEDNDNEEEEEEEVVKEDNNDRNEDENKDKQYQQTILMKQYNQIRTLCLKNITELITMLPSYDYYDKWFEVFYSYIQPLIEQLPLSTVGSNKSNPTLLRLTCIYYYYYY